VKIFILAPALAMVMATSTVSGSGGAAAKTVQVPGAVPAFVVTLSHNGQLVGEALIAPVGAVGIHVFFPSQGTQTSVVHVFARFGVPIGKPVLTLTKQKPKPQPPCQQCPTDSRIIVHPSSPSSIAVSDSGRHNEQTNVPVPTGANGVTVYLYGAKYISFQWVRPGVTEPKASLPFLNADGIAISQPPIR
jgi:hypothetical protein